MRRRRGEGGFSLCDLEMPGGEGNSIYFSGLLVEERGEKRLN
jgi:hypothetical protein